MTAFDAEVLYHAVPALRVEDCFGLPFSLDPTQRAVINDRGGRILVCCTRQWGKTTTVAAKAACEALDEPGLIVVVAPVERQARELFRKLRDMLRRALPKAPWPEDNKLSLELPNGSRVVAVPARGENIRGYSNPRMIIIDEAAFVPDEDYRAIRPMLAHGSKLVIMSTPFGRRGFFHEAWTNSHKQFWHRYSVKADECGHISPEFLAEERKAIGDWWYRQEYECRFLDAADGFFNMDAVRAALDDGMPALFAARGVEAWTAGAGEGMRALEFAGRA